MVAIRYLFFFPHGQQKQLTALASRLPIKPDLLAEFAQSSAPAIQQCLPIQKFSEDPETKHFQEQLQENHAVTETLLSRAIGHVWGEWGRGRAVRCLLPVKVPERSSCCRWFRLIWLRWATPRPPDRRIPLGCLSLTEPAVGCTYLT
eukprot:EG_transcript_42202